MLQGPCVETVRAGVETVKVEWNGTPRPVWRCPEAGVAVPGALAPCNSNKNHYICRRVPELTTVPVCFV